jgi:hypothetical protein
VDSVPYTSATAEGLEEGAVVGAGEGAKVHAYTPPGGSDRGGVALEGVLAPGVGDGVGTV